MLSLPVEEISFRANPLGISSALAKAPAGGKIRPRRALAAGQVHHWTLQPGATIKVVSAVGAQLLEISDSAEGPIIRLGAGRDVALDVPGALELSADRLSLTARCGDVVVRGETIRLN